MRENGTSQEPLSQLSCFNNMPPNLVPRKWFRRRQYRGGKMALGTRLYATFNKDNCFPQR
jgi:hypothetical protein